MLQNLSSSETLTSSKGTPATYLMPMYYSNIQLQLYQ